MLDKKEKNMFHCSYVDKNDFMTPRMKEKRTAECSKCIISSYIVDRVL